MRRSVFALFVVITAAATLVAQTPPAAQSVAKGPQPLWMVSSGLASPESAHYHPQSGSIFVSNINGGVLDNDGNGYITRIARGGKVIGEKWATGLSAPKGIRSAGMTIWVADIEKVVGFELTADGARLVSRVSIDGATMLNDLATAPDGTIYVSESNQSRIYVVKDGKAAVFVEGADVGPQPNGLLVDGDRLIVGTIGAGGGRGGRGASPGAGQLIAFDLKTKARTLVTTEPVGGIDGIEPAEPGAYFVTDVLGRRLLHVARDGKVSTLATFEQAGADIGVQPLTEQLAQAGTVFVQLLFSNSVAAYDLYPLIRATR